MSLHGHPYKEKHVLIFTVKMGKECNTGKTEVKAQLQGQRCEHV